MKDRPIIHPYLFAVYPVFYLYSKNGAKVSVIDTLFPIVLLIGAAFILVRLLIKMTGSKEASAVAVSAFFIWLFSYSAVHELITFDFMGLKLYRHRTFIVIWLVILAISAIALYMGRSKAVQISRYLSVFAPVLILLPIGSLVAYAWHRPAPQRELSMQVPSTSHDVRAQSDSLPDVYYIILDAYTGQSALKKYLGIDNSEFVSYLRRKGFFVAANSHSNYSWTGLSVGSSLNMEYLAMHPDPAEPGRSIVDQPTSEADMVRQNKVASCLSALGYEYVDLSIWRASSHANSSFDAYQFLTSDFNLEVLRMTLLNRPMVMGYLLGRTKRDIIIKRFDELRNLPESGSPRFVYAHILVPHHPYVFDENGNAPSFFDLFSELRPEKELYRRQLVYASKEIEKTIDAILTRSKRKPIIVIQGDHGAYRLGNPEIEYEQIRMSILNAYYVPDSARRLLYDTISPVNTFRLILSTCYGQDYPLLPDENYVSGVDDIYAVKRVTNLMDR